MVYFYPWSNQLIPDFKKPAAPDPIELPAIPPMIPPMIVPAAIPMGPPKVPMVVPVAMPTTPQKASLVVSFQEGPVWPGAISLAAVIRPFLSLPPCALVCFPPALLLPLRLVVRRVHPLR